VDIDPLRSPPSVGWFPDPLRRFDFRYYNGERWTNDVAANGARFIDPGPFSPPRSGGGQRPAAPLAGRHPSRSLAVLALVLGLAGVALAWAPFIFVLGGAGSIAAIVLGTVSLRRTKRLDAAGAAVDTARSGRGMALAAICLGPVGLGLCVIGVILTGIAYREFNQYVDPGPHRVDETACSLDGGRATYTGTITNLDDESRDYELLLQFLDGTRIEARDRVALDDVAPGSTAEWRSSGRVGEIDLRCRVWDVTGPYPFGLERNG
jgi:hypothetical protein